MRKAGFIAMIGLALAGLADRATAQPVRTADGRIAGTAGADPGYRVFRGIPYAAPPVGPLRWAPPSKPRRWAGVLAADRFRPDCYSPRPTPGSAAGGQSEDCLYLNVYTPAPAHQKLPVMVWIYGGAFSGGTPTAPQFDGAGLNRKGVILVTFAYRTSVFGFLSHPALTAESPHHASGNYGLLDAVAALQRVNRNIAAFGGDPANVTLFGQSSGSGSVQALVTSPLTRGLFAKVIGESGANFGERDLLGLTAAEANGTAYAVSLGRTAAELRARSASELVAAIGTRKFEPVVDGWFLPADARDSFARGEAARVPALIGANADEAQLAPALTLANYPERVRASFYGYTDEVLRAFPAADDSQARSAYKALMSIALGDYNVGSWADGQARLGSPVWQYRFEHAPPPSRTPPAPQGAYHGAEIPYAFNNLHMLDRAWTDADRATEAMLSSYWTNFARTGDPNGPGLPRWERLDPARPRVLVIGDAPAMAPRPNADMVALLGRLYYAPGVVRGPKP